MQNKFPVTCSYDITLWIFDDVFTLIITKSEDKTKKIDVKRIGVMHRI